MKIDDITLHDSLSKSLRGLNSLAKILKKRRIENGYVLQSMPQYKMVCTITEYASVQNITVFNYLIVKCK